MRIGLNSQRLHRGDAPGKYEALKDYLGKHIAHIYNNNIDGPKLSESWRDLAVYSIIAMVMCDVRVTEKGIQGTSCDAMFMDEASRVIGIGSRVQVISSCIYKNRVGTVLAVGSTGDQPTAYVVFDGEIDLSTKKTASGSYEFIDPQATIFWLSELKLLEAE